MGIIKWIPLVIILTFAIAYSTVRYHEFQCGHKLGVMESLADEYGFVPKEMMDEWREDCEGKTWLELRYQWGTVVVGVIGIILIIVGWYSDRKKRSD